MVGKQHRIPSKTKYFCPYCNHSLYKWKEEGLYTVYKCGNDNCPEYLRKQKDLNASEKQVSKSKSSQFKLRYQFREYHFAIQQLEIKGTEQPRVNLANIHNHSTVLGLVLAFHISIGITARKTAYLLKAVFNIKISYQTILNYAEAASYYCHQFNLKHKGAPGNISCGDETYIKIAGKYWYTYFVVSNHKITAYNVADSRNVLPATATLSEAIKNADENQSLTIITDGNPSYAAATLFINHNQKTKHPIELKQVIGLKNLDTISEQYRPYKQIIERLNRTYKAHVRPAAGFNHWNGAMAYTTLFTTHYNFLRPHMSLQYQTPVRIQDLDGVQTLQDKWIKILKMAA